MTVSSSTNRIAYTGNGVTTAFAVPFKFLANSDLAVYLDDVLQATGFAAAGAGADSGTVTFAVAPALNVSVVILRNQPYTQNTVLAPSGPFPAKTLETMADKGIIAVQQVAEVTSRALKFPPSDGAVVNDSLPARASRPGLYLAFDANGDPTVSSGTGADAGLRTDLASGLSGALLVAFKSSGLGAVVRTLWAVLMDQPASVKNFGAKGDGATDDSAALQAAFNIGGRILLPAGTFITTPLTVAAHTTLTFDPAATLKAKSGYGLNDCLLNISGVANVTILGNGGAVQMLKAEYLTGEQRHAVSITGSSHVNIYGLTARDSGGDGFYLGGNMSNEDVNLLNCVADNNRRNGCSIVNVIGCNVIGGEYKNTIGTAPEAGIDIESNLLDGYNLQGVNVIGVRTSNNNGAGIKVTPQSMYAPVSINVKNCTSYYDGGSGTGGLSISAAMAYTGATDPSLIGKIRGAVLVSDCSVINPQAMGVASFNWTEDAPFTKLQNIYVLNPYSNAGVLNANRNKVGMLIRGELSSSGEYGSSVGNIEVDGLRCEDNRLVKVMVAPLYFEMADEVAKPLKNVLIRNLEGSNTTEYTNARPILSNSAQPRTNVRVSFRSEQVRASGSKTFSLADLGTVWTQTGASAFYTLPLASDFIGSEFTARVTDVLGILQLGTSGSDVIADYTSAPGTQIIGRNVGCQITVRATAAGVWQVTNIVGRWALYTYFGARVPETYYSGVPGTGTWEVGDHVWDTAPTAGGFMGWVCVVAGSPGTWKTFGPITA